MGCRSCTSILNIDTFEYNDFGELTTSRVNGVHTHYTYRPDGMRNSKLTGGVETKHVWDNEYIVMDLNSDWTVKGAYTRGVHLIDFADSTGTCWQYSVNRHGDVSAMVNSVTGEDIGYEYDAYGNQSDITAADTNPFRYSGEYFDSETGLIYLRARYYDSAIGRFISEDPVRDGTNWFVYCANNPVMLHDPSGLAILLGNDLDFASAVLHFVASFTNDIVVLVQKRNKAGKCEFQLEVRHTSSGDDLTDGTKLARKVIDAKEEIAVKVMTKEEEADRKAKNNFYHALFSPDEEYNTGVKEGKGGTIYFSQEYFYEKADGLYIGAGVLGHNRRGKKEIVNENTPLYLALIHEMIHAMHLIDATYEVKKEGWYIINGKIQRLIVEELLSVGFENSSEEISDDEITENSIRDELGINKRMVY